MSSLFLLRDAKIIAPAIPVTGTMLSSKRYLYDQQKFLNKDQELKLRLDEITQFPHQVGYLWLKSQLKKAIRVKTRFHPTPEKVAGCSHDDLLNFAENCPIINLIPRSQIVRELNTTESSLLNNQEATTANDTKSQGKTKQELEDLMQVLEKAHKKGKVSSISDCEQSISKIKGKLHFFLTDRKLQRHLKGSPIIPDILCSFSLDQQGKKRRYILSIEYDAGTENPQYLLKSRKKNFMKLQQIPKILKVSKKPLNKII